ncbi:protein rep [Acinetobacter junii]|uniref:protein rep n=1 Tax=Acinetobacter junii TaxID=40215 RepID=UPI003214959E
MSLFYGGNPSNSSKSVFLDSFLAQKSARLGTQTKSHVMLTPQGFQRVHDYLLQDQSSFLLPKERVRKCRRYRIDKTKTRTVMYNEAREKAHYGNVQICGSIWSCPVCAKQITQQRRLELKEGIDRWKTAFNGSVYLLTLTFSHSPDQSLKSNLEGLKKAMKRFYETTRVQSIFKHLGVAHKIKGFEVTYGLNGWHPHHHVLLLASYHNLKFKDYRSELSELWIKACVRSGLNSPSMQHGLDIRNGFYADQYVSKWGLEDELTKGHIKKGKNGGLTPFDLLNLSIDDFEVFGKKPSKLFQEFAISVKGSRQLVWSRGLKNLLQIADKTDQELAEETDKQSITLQPVEDLIFYLLCSYKKRHEYLEAIASDYENGCFGNGLANKILDEILQLEINRLGV